ncbi:MAG TPA: hypothetical protein VHC47_02785 [Mucilaginibacter sp.]|nr:hypothetical protein [Mucilaginibacter sp.]
MKELNDEELQRLLKAGKSFPADEPLSDGANAYQTLFEALKSEPESGLPYDFAAKVTRHVSAEVKKNSEVKYYLLAAFIFVAAIAAVCAVLAINSPAQEPELLKYKWVLLLLPLVFVAIQYFDQRFVKSKIFRNPNT